MISHNLTETQEAPQNILTSIFRDVPAVLTDGGTRAYVLVKDMSREMEEFICAGKADSSELRVFSEDHERELFREWSSMGFECICRSRQMEYMCQRVTVKYPEVRNPRTGVRIALIPWFMLPDRPYPIFVYLYAVRHYDSSVRKSMSLSAAAAGKLFRISGFSKSTVSRTLKVMDDLLIRFQITGPLPVDEPVTPSAAETAGRVSELLESCQSMEMIKDALGTEASALPPAIGRGGSVSKALSLIPAGLSDVIIIKAPETGKNRDSRKRAARPRAWAPRHVKRGPDFVEPHKLEHIRREFTAVCRAAVLNAAVTYHRFLM
jgi:hypothetical protein